MFNRIVVVWSALKCQKSLMHKKITFKGSLYLFIAKVFPFVALHGNIKNCQMSWRLKLEFCMNSQLVLSLFLRRPMMRVAREWESPRASSARNPVGRGAGDPSSVARSVFRTGTPGLQTTSPSLPAADPACLGWDPGAARPTGKGALAETETLTLNVSLHQLTSNCTHLEILSFTILVLEVVWASIFWGHL